MRLSTALRIVPGQSIAFVGAGGKSSVIRTLVSEIQPKTRVIVTTTTKLGLTQTDIAQEHLILGDNHHLDDAASILRSARSLLVTREQVRGEPKWLGLTLPELEELRKGSGVIDAILLIEADGARMKSLKAPGEHEPVVPEWVDSVVSIAGLDVVGKPFIPEYCHRAERAKEILEISGEVKIDERHVSQLLRSRLGGLKGAPPSATVRVLLRQGEISNDLELGRRISVDVLTSQRVQSVLIGTLKPEDPIRETISRTAGVVLAAGSSKRLAGPKQLIPFKGEPLIVWAVRAAIEGNLNPIIVVVGDDGDSISQALQGYDVLILRNPDPGRGQGSSLQVGVSGVPPTSEAAIFLLADMPLINSDLILELKRRYYSSMAPIIVPYEGGRRGNPVLFDRGTFDDLLRVEGDQGGRAIFSKYPHERIEWDDSIHFDIDSPEDLERLRAVE